MFAHVELFTKCSAINQYSPKECREFLVQNKKDNISVKVLNASIHSSISVQFVYNSKSANSYNQNMFEIIKTGSCVFDLIKLEAICIE